MTPAPSCCSGWSPAPTNADPWPSDHNWPFEQWGRFLLEQTTAVSILDRLLHHATVVITDGDSYRMKDAHH
jgi:hypothetical protein